MSVEFRPSSRLARISESPSTAAAARVRALKAEGREIIDFTVGEPDFDTPRNVKDAAIAAIEAGRTKYTSVNGTPELREAIRGRVERRTGLRYEDAEITVGGGGKQVIYLAFTATLDVDDEVLIPAPYWVSYPDMVRANDGTPVILPTSASTAYKLTPDALREAITPRTRWLVLNAPSNPTGVAYTAEELEALAAVLDEAPHVMVLSDEIYDEISYTGEPARSLVAVAPRLRERVLLVNGVSKSYAMTGWRLGYAVGGRGVIGAINVLQSQTSSCPSSISQAAAVEALSGDQSFVAASVEVYRARRDLAVSGLRDVPGISPIVPDGAFYLFVDVSGLIGRTTPSGSILETDQDVVLHLLESEGVAVIQGSAYGLSPYVRMSFATSDEQIAAGVAAIGRAVAALG